MSSLIFPDIGSYDNWQDWAADFQKAILEGLDEAEITSLDIAMELSISVTPIGGIVAWHKSFANTPALPDGWVQCDGQTLNDGGSVYNGQVIPDLNGDARFLRGSSVSGTDQAEDFLAHLHSKNSRVNAAGLGGSNLWALPTNTGTPATIDTNLTGGAETRPINMSVVWIMRVK